MKSVKIILQILTKVFILFKKSKQKPKQITTYLDSHAISIIFCNFAAQNQFSSFLYAIQGIFSIQSF